MDAFGEATVDQDSVNRVLESAVHCMLVKCKFYPHDVRVSDPKKKSEEKQQVKARGSKRMRGAVEQLQSPLKRKREESTEAKEKNKKIAQDKNSSPAVKNDIGKPQRAALSLISANTSTAQHPHRGERASVRVCAGCCSLLRAHLSVLQ